MQIGQNALRMPGAAHHREKASMNLGQIAQGKALTLSADTTVGVAVDAAVEAKVGAIAVLEADKLVGIFTERDVMKKIVQPRLDPDQILLRDVMSTPVYAVRPTMHVQDALRTMVERNVRHLIVSEDGVHVDGVVELRAVLEVMLEYMQKNLKQMESYLGR